MGWDEEGLDSLSLERKTWDEERRGFNSLSLESYAVRGSIEWGEEGLRFSVTKGKHRMGRERSGLASLALESFQ